MDAAQSVFLSGIVLGSLYAMMATGLSLVWTTLGIFNFAHGIFMALGALIAWQFGNDLGWGLGPAAGLALGVAALIVLVRAAVTAPEPESASGSESGATAWPAWSPPAAAEIRSSGRPLFIDFTAAWCLSCQVNERVVLNKATVRDAFRDHGVTTLKADWTRRDPAITGALAELERSSVPVYALYPGGAVDPVLLPSVLTKDIVLEALETYVPLQE